MSNQIAVDVWRDTNTKFLATRVNNTLCSEGELINALFCNGFILELKDTITEGDNTTILWDDSQLEKSYNAENQQ